MSPIIEMLLKGVAHAVGMLAPLVPVLAPVFIAFMRDQRHVAAFGAVTRAGMLAANEAAHAMRSAFDKARDPASPGGSNVTREEFDSVMKAGVEAGLKYLADHKLLDQVLEVYGGREAVEKALFQLVVSKSKEVFEALKKQA